MVNQLTAESPVREYIALIKKQFACGDALSWCEGYSDLTVGELYEKGIADGTVTDSWVAWTLMVIGEHLSEKLREYLIRKLQEPMLAAHLYMRITWLTDNEDNLLLDKFRGKLPVVEKRLEEGIAKREKITDGRNSV